MSDESQKTNDKRITDDKILGDSLDGVAQLESSDHKPSSKSKKKGKDATIPKRDSKARTASAAVFFNDNKAIAGFGNSMRSVFTSIRELVENSLDASEKRESTPIIKLKMRRLSKKEVNKLMGTSVVKTKETRVDFLELSCQDNGVGVSRELIPQLFGTVLAGTKYGAQQTRGRFGLGSKMVLLHAMSTLDLPIEITTRPFGEDKTYRIKLFINLEKNAPIIHKDEVFVEGDEYYLDDYGTAIKVSFTGSWNLAKNYVREYFKQLAIITPYADIETSLPADEIGVQDESFYKRVVDELPKPPEVIKIHPWGTDISTFRREMSHSDDNTILDFLVNTFMGVNSASAESFLQEVGVDPSIAPTDLSSQEIRRIVHDGFTRALKESKLVKRKRDRVFKFDEPSGEALSPLGADRLRKGLEKELQPEFVEAITRPPHAYAGHPFIIEAAIGYGGGVNAAAASKGATVVENRVIYRYANRIPLIFGAGNDLITQEINAINWSDYGLTRGTEPLAIAVSLVSTKIPFPETSKEYIASVTEISEEVKLVLMQLGRKLKTFLGRRRRRQRERQRKSRFEKFAPKTVNNLLGILEQEDMWNPTTGIAPSRIIAALSSGKPRIGSNFIPYGTKLSEAPIWSTLDTIQKLQNNNIFELSTFLRTPNTKLTTILKWKEKEVDLVKRRTINELENKGEILEIDTEVLLKPEIERRFHKKTTDKLIELPRLSKALYRRWIRNTYDYLISPADKLKLVQGLFVKLMEAEKVKIVSGITEEGDELLLDDLTDLLDQLSDGGSTGFEAFFEEETKELDVSVTAYEDLSPIPYQSTSENLILTDIRPSFNDIKEFEAVKKRKVKTLFEFLLETAHPSSPLDEKTLSLSIVGTFKEKLFELIASNMEIGNIKVSVAGQAWLDGYLRNAFKRRNIDTLNDLLNTDDKILAEIGELQRTLFTNMMDPYVQEKGTIAINQFTTNNAEIKIKILKKAGINTIEQFLSTPITDLSQNEKLIKYFDMLIEDSKDELISFLTLQNSLGELPLIKIIPKELEEELDNLELFNTVDFLKKPVKYFDPKFKDRVIYAKQIIGGNFTGFSQTQTRLFSKLNISVLEELVFHPEAYLEEELTEREVKTLELLINQLMKPINYLEPQLLPSLDILF
ncbi:MAG: DNA topoisomerase VI subunit B, partial [Candidatus Heimdallarchaeota archaeon]|nr:DNA topoisomerase VI subunit B [Candidatus Heimdallarchaeota archaeon]